ncbi:HAD family hydrolase [Fundicoccus culcitae]|uniref:HAD family hydrolase n=1 Tax=Fundicoccus culcitae TaxID=2969821 RepID=A0ABY5P2Z2_9LACT|nr:HAD family hydrolase [Fundicoccus culcitae]UUX32980.1 HAD family hydrolase [Fundicoccus culcitae]
MLKGIIFDKDGTLVELGNSWDQPTIEVVNILLEETDLTENEKKAFKLSIGVTDTAILSNSTVAAGSIEDQAKAISLVLPLSVAEISERIESYFMDYFKGRQDPIPVIDGVVESLETLKDQGYFLGVVTNDNQKLTDMMLTRAGLISYFDFIGNADQYGSKPESSAFDVIHANHGIPPHELVYVGDSSVDMEFGAKTKAAIGLALEDEHLDHLKEADYIIRSFTELIPLLSKLNELN